MVIFHTEHIIEIGYYHQFANDMRVTNMLLVFSNNARTNQIEFKSQGDYRDTYNALWYMRTLALDPGRFSVRPGNDWDRSSLLKTPLAINSIPSFLPLFSKFILPLLAASNPCFDSCGLLMYYGMY